MTGEVYRVDFSNGVGILVRAFTAKEAVAKASDLIIVKVATPIHAVPSAEYLAGVWAVAHSRAGR